MEQNDPLSSFLRGSTPNDESPARKLFLEMLAAIIPTAVYIFSQFMLLVISLRFIAQNMPTAAVDGVGIGNTWLAAVYISIVVGLNTGTSTFGAQAFGALNYPMVARYFQRGFILRMINIIPSYGLCFASYYIFRAMGVEESIAWAAWDYCVHSLAAMIGLACYDTLKAYVMAHNIFIPPMIAQILIAVVHWLWCILFVDKLDLGIKGVAYAFAASEFTGAIILTVFIFLNKEFENTRIRPTKESLEGLWNQFKNEIYVASFIILEFLAFECCILVAGQLDENELAAQALTYSIITILTTPAIALSTIGTIYIGTSLGQKNACKARVITKVIVLIAILFWGIQAVVMYTFNEKVVSFFPVSEHVQKATISGLMTYLYFMPVDIFQCSLTSILKGVGREKITAVLYLIAFYVIGLSMAYVFGVRMEKNTSGIWLGMGIGICSMAAMSGWLLWKTDYDYQIMKIETRMIEDESLLLMNDESFREI